MTNCYSLGLVLTSGNGNGSGSHFFLRLIRLAGSLKLGHLKAAGVMRTPLQVKDKPTTRARALTKLGRIILGRARLTD